MRSSCFVVCGFSNFSYGNHDILIDNFVWFYIWAIGTNTLSWTFSFRQINISITICVVVPLWLTKCNFTQQKNSSLIWKISTTIVSWFTSHVGKVYTFTVVISSLRSFRWGYSQTLTQNSSEVRESTTMPK